MAPRALTPEEAQKLGLPSLAPASSPRAPLAPHEARALGLPELQPPPAAPKVDGLTSTLRGASQGLSKGWSDEALGWLTSQVPEDTVGLNDSVRDLADRWKSIASGGGGGLPKDSSERLSGDYETERDRYRQLNADAKDAHPVLYGAGEFAGNVASDSVLPGGYGGAALGGALSGAGNSERSGLGLAGDTVGGAALGVAGHQLGEKLGTVIPRAARAVSDKLGEFAERRALNAAGYGRNEIRAIVRDRGEDRALEMGRQLLEEPGVIGFGANAAGIQPGIDAARSSWGAEVGKSLQQADAAGGRFDFSRVARRVIDDVIKPNLKDPSVKGEIDAISSQLKDYLRFYPEGSTFERANELKSTLQNGTINWGNHWNNYGPSHFLDQYQKQLAGIFNDEIEQQLGQQLGPEAQAAFQNAKSHAGTFIDSAGKVAEQAGKDAVDTVALKDLAAGSFLTPVLGPLGGLGGTLAARLARHRGASALAVGADTLASSGPLASLASAAPQALGEYAGAVGQAAGESPEALAALHFLLGQSDPKYQRRVQAAAGQSPGATP